MKKLFLLVPAFLTMVLLFSVINADEGTKPTTEKKNPDNTSKPDETPKVDPGKKYEIKFNFTKGMSFERTDTKTSQSSNTLFNSDLTVKRTIKSNKSQSIEKFKYTILDTKEGKITKFKSEFPEYVVRLGRSPMGDPTFPKSSTIYKNQWIEVNSSDPDFYKIEKYSPEFASLTTDEEKLYKGMMSLESFHSGCSPNPFGYNREEHLISLQYKPNIQYLNSISNKLLFPDYSPGKPVSVGDTWKIKCAELKDERKQLFEIVKRKLTEFVDDYRTTLELEFKLESTKIENDNEFAILTFSYNYSSPVQSPFNEASKYSYEGMVVHNLTKNRVVHLSVLFMNSRIWQHNEFGKYASQSTNKRSFEYKYDD